MVALIASACASTSSQSPVAGSQKQLPTSSDIADLRVQLEEARAAMVARETAPPPPVTVDLDAAVSMPIPDNHFVKSAVALFSTSLKKDIQTYLTRSARYKKMIEKALAEEGLP